MALRINNNIPALKALRNLDETSRSLADSLERLSSGFKINKGADNPAGLIISEQMRAQLAGLNQAIANSELDNTMIQTTEGALTEVNNLLIRMRQLALQAANEGANDEATLEAAQLEIDNGISSLARIAESAQFGKKKLLDGSTGISGEAQGRGVTFLKGSVNTKTSPIEGYQVEITQVATRPMLEGSTSIDDKNVRGLDVTLFVGGKTVRVRAAEGDTAPNFFGKLQSEVQQAGLAVEVTLTKDDTISIVHKEFGSEPTFRAVSSVSGIISEKANVVQQAETGKDIQGTIGAEAAVGKGQVLTGVPGSENTDGLSVRYSGPLVVVNEDGPDGRPVLERRPTTGTVGTVNVANNSLRFQIVPDASQKTVVALPSVRPQFLSRAVENQSGFNNLAEINVRNSQGAEDSIKLIDTAIDQMNLTRGQLGAFQRNEVEKNISTLRVAVENLTAAESTIRDANVAEEVVEATKKRIKLQATVAAIAQANQMPGIVIDLLR
ncbi:MAG: flagellin [SAR324 cluster bacterium]|nr:flagellin [SAR324 cluster bacterium]